MEHSLEELEIRGNRMQQILSDPLMIEAFESTKTRIVEAWKSADTPPKREAQHAKLMALEELKTELQAVVDHRDYAKGAARRISRRS